MNWAAPFDGGASITTYIIYWQAGSESTQMSIVALQTSYKINGLQPARDYQVAVVAQNSLGEGPRSELTPIRTIARGAPSHPYAVMVEPRDRVLDIAWNRTPTSDVLSGYRVYWTVSGKTKNSNNLSSLRRSYRIGSLMNGLTYEIVVAAFNDIGESRASTITGTPRTNPDQVILGDIVGSTNTITVNWAAPFDGGASITTYIIYWQAGSESTQMSVVALQTSYKISGLQPARNYQVTVAAQNSAGEGPRSELASIRTIARGAPSRPHAVVVTARDRILDVVWERITMSDVLLGYRVYWTASGSTKTVSSDNLSSPTRNYTITGLVNGEVYES